MRQKFIYTDYPAYIEYLKSFAEDSFAAFQRKLIPGETILGVRTPRLRSIAKQIAAGELAALSYRCAGRHHGGNHDAGPGNRECKDEL